MKPCQNKLDILRRSPSRLVLSVLMASVWLGVGLLPAAAQQGEPVNLLSIAPTPADSGQIAVNSPLDIDQAFGSNEVYLRFGYWARVDVNKLQEIVGQPVEEKDAYDEDCGYQFCYSLK